MVNYQLWDTAQMAQNHGAHGAEHGAEHGAHGAEESKIQIITGVRKVA